MKFRITLTLAALAVAGSALAQPPAATPEMQAARAAMRQACAADMKTLCDGKEGREMMQCMRASADKVSAPCKDAMSKMPQRPPPPPAG
jgi:hypothetical protein